MNKNNIRKMRIPVEIQQIQKNEKQHGIHVTTTAQDENQLLADIKGPLGSPYEDGRFQVQINFCDLYPFRPPKFKFTTRVYHPNIDQSGNICLDILKMPPTGSYNPALTLESLLLSIQLLLLSPNPDDPLNGEAADLYKTNQSQFCERAREYVEKYCTGNGVKNVEAPLKANKEEEQKESKTDKVKTFNKLKL